MSLSSISSSIPSQLIAGKLQKSPSRVKTTAEIVGDISLAPSDQALNESDQGTRKESFLFTDESEELDAMEARPKQRSGTTHMSPTPTRYSGRKAVSSRPRSAILTNREADHIHDENDYNAILNSYDANQAPPPPPAKNTSDGYAQTSRPPIQRAATFNTSSSQTSSSLQISHHEASFAECTMRPPHIPLPEDFRNWSKEEMYRDIEALTYQIEDLRQENQELQEQNKNAAMELNSMKNEKSFNRDDDFFKNGLGQLNYRVKNWAGQFFNGEARSHALPSSLRSSTANSKENIYRLTFSEDFAKFAFRNPSRRPFVVEAYMWSVLLNTVFSDKGNVWAGRLQKPVIELQRSLDPTQYKDKTEADLGYFHSWRAVTTGLVQERTISQHEQSAYITQVMTQVKWLGRYSESDQWSTMEPDLREIFAHAINFDAEMKKQRAQYCLIADSMRHTKLYFNPTTMESVDGAQHPATAIVAFVIRPWLYKRGTSAGDDYLKAAQLIVKGTVMIYLAPQQPQIQQQSLVSPQLNMVSISDQSLSVTHLAHQRQVADLQPRGRSSPAQLPQEESDRARQGRSKRSGRERSRSRTGLFRRSMDGQRPEVYEQSQQQGSFDPAMGTSATQGKIVSSQSRHWGAGRK
ncbi:hypothetical protein BT63DRAFT_438661 [Microthyrium microscopicum]|uniref:Uncharacterized protein n=1 Tax=Microthyrium microscopicum TaxID=703497 RepID=A0A6A6UG24_9PEZI|nr:hypothetical protein BT63DRAFT_438661 [Microthyrium microscopicum]